MNNNSPEAQQLVGRAFRCDDGLVRWIIYLSTRRGYFSVLWRDDESEVWHSGGIIRADKWRGGQEVRAPQPGETYRLVGATGVENQRTA